MTAEWTVERLDALPEGTVLTFLDAVGEWDLALRARSRRGGELVWMMPDRAGAWWTSSRLLRGTDHRVISVPVDALLSDESAWLLSGELNAPLLASANRPKPAGAAPPTPKG